MRVVIAVMPRPSSNAANVHNQAGWPRNPPSSRRLSMGSSLAGPDEAELARYPDRSRAMTSNAATVYREHLATIKARSDLALQQGGFDHLIVPAGIAKYRFLDDMHYPFKANPHFLHWLPLTEHPYSWIAYTPGKKPVLAYYQPDDYWHVPPTAPEGDWVEHFDIRILRDPAEATQHLPSTGKAAIIGESDA